MPASPPRLISLDGLRGLAVMGILLMNIAGFALPAAAYFNPLAYRPAGPAELALWAIEFVLVDTKMRALFSLLFGASLLLVLDRARAAGMDSERAHFRRMGWLALFGLIHYYLIWHGDILLLYAVVGCAAWFFSEASTRDLIRWGLLLIALQCLIFIALFVAITLDGPGSEGWRAVQEEFGVPAAATIARDLALHRGSYAGLVAHRLFDAGWLPLTQILLFGCETLGLMLLGMAGLRSGFLTGGWGRMRYLRAAAIGYAIGLPLTLLVAWLCWRSGFDARMILAAAFPLGVPARPFMLLGHAALALAWLAGPPSPLRTRVAAAGRAAFTNYLGASLVMTALFYGYGAGLYGTLGRFALLGVVAGAWLLMLLWSKPWLGRFAYGPLEWLWRSLARGKMQPMRKLDIARHSQ
ncbi:uncharacterized protein SAMN06295912_102172 [Sphingomonas laterariae]|uniref:DUF418 domain-containing protein n=1 Tax=Edaphosphingomonas laterariae TaxID=861865 RepID=A0A239CGA0_9SPHN|nr:DUF418 domain-containing protein [Sphingomonas laterariae]SNS18698.1 uncharacterized protein SAMN06295912_102172 [Sphingomonas laterariae]